MPALTSFSAPKRSRHSVPLRLPNKLLLFVRSYCLPRHRLSEADAAICFRSRRARPTSLIHSGRIVKTLYRFRVRLLDGRSVAIPQGKVALIKVGL